MTSTNVVKMVPRSYAGIKDAEAAMTVIRNAMYGHDVQMMAIRCGVSASCIFAIRSGRTKWPRSTTFFSLLYYLDLEMIIQPRSNK
jgi:hypothetical protein